MTLEKSPSTGENSGQPKRRRRPWRWPSLAGLAIITAACGALLLQQQGGSPAGDSEPDPLDYAQVVITDLVQEETLNGSLGYIEAAPVKSQLGGTVTDIAAPGDTISQGQTLFAIAGQPAVLLYGDLPAFRDIVIGEDIIAVSSPSNGTITWIAEPGAVIQQGDVIYRVDDRPVVALYGDRPAYRDIGAAGINLELIAAQANLASGKAGLTALTTLPGEGELQVATEQLNSANHTLQTLLAPPDPDAVRIATANLTVAEMNQQAAQAHLNDLLEGPDPEAVEAARLNWYQAKNSLWAAQASRDSTCGAAAKGNASSASCSGANASVANQEINVQKAEIAYLSAQAGPSDEDISSARTSVAATEAQLASVQKQANELQEGASQGQIAAARAQVAQAKVVLDAQLEGPDPDAVAAAEAHVTQAQAHLDTLLSGPSPADPGPDVQQLEEALVALGYDPKATVTVDEEFTAATQEMIRAWQEDIGAQVDGVVDLGEAVFLPGPAQVLDVFASPGGQAGGGVVSVATGDPATGLDIRQLEKALIALGHDASGTLVADGSYTLETYQAVLDFQAATGHEPDGIIGPGEIVFLPSSVRVTSQVTTKGRYVSAGASVLDVSLTEKVVHIALPANQQDLLTAGDAVTVELPDETLVPATVTYISQIATPAGGGSAWFEARATLDDPEAVTELDAAPVDIIIVSDSIQDVMAVPVSALVALLEGGYAVEVDAGGGKTKLVGVEVGFFGSNNLVQITSAALQPGDQVVVP